MVRKSRASTAVHALLYCNAKSLKREEPSNKPVPTGNLKVVGGS